MTVDVVMLRTFVVVDPPVAPGAALRIPDAVPVAAAETDDALPATAVVLT